jgi:hypothetical protein
MEPTKDAALKGALHVHTYTYSIIYAYSRMNFRTGVNAELGGKETLKK